MLLRVSLPFNNNGQEGEGRLFLLYIDDAQKLFFEDQVQSKYRYD